MDDGPTVPDSSDSRRVVLTGAVGHVAEAVKTHLRRAGVHATAFERGDDVLEGVAKAEIVIVLDASRLGDTSGEYRFALRAVEQGVRRSTAVPRIITVTLVPPAVKARTAFQQTAEESERIIRALGVELTVLRCGVVYGTSAMDGPADAALLSDRLVLVPGPGTQRVAPIDVEALAAEVISEVEREKPEPSSVRAVAGDEISLEQLAADLNGAGVSIKPMSQLASRALRVGLLLLPVLMFAPRPEVWLPAEDLVSDEIARPPLDTEQETEELPLRAQRRERHAAVKAARAYRMPAWVVAFAIALLLLGAAETPLGAQMVLAAPTLSEKVSGGFLLLAGLLAALGGAALLRTTMRARYMVAVVSGMIACLGLAVWVFFSVLLIPDAHLWPQIVAGYLTVFVLAPLTWLTVRRAKLGFRTYLKTPGRAKLSITVFVTVLLGLAQFVYFNIYVPSTRRAGVGVTATAKAGQASKDGRLLTVNVAMRNFSEGQVFVLGSIVRVTGLRDAAAGWPSRGEDVVRRLPAENSEAMTYMSKVTSRRAIADGTLAHFGSFLSPGETIRRQYVLTVPSQFTRARVSVVASVLRYDGRELVEGVDARIVSSDQSFVATTRKLREESWLARLTHRRRYVHSLRPLKDKSIPGCFAGRLQLSYVDHDRSVDERDPGCGGTGVESEYDLLVVDTSTEVATSR